MPDSDLPLQSVLDAFGTFLADKHLALQKHRPCMVRWVREFLLFAREHGG